MPFDLAVAGMRGCSLLVSPDATFGATSSPIGEARFGFDLPGDPSLLGAALHARVIARHPAVHPQGSP